MNVTVPTELPATPATDGSTIDVLDHGFVRLDGCMADDLSVANSARVSFGARKERLDDSDAGLIRFLLRERHGTPFEHNSFRFHIRCPIFVAREWFRHRIGSFNEYSARYKEMKAEFYVPAPVDVRTQVGKPGSYVFEPVDDATATLTRELMEATYQGAWDAYQRMLDTGVAKEIARCVLPVGIYTEFYWTVNARALMNFLSLRNAPNAQREIQRFAQAIEPLFERAMPITYAAFVANDRRSP